MPSLSYRKKGITISRYGTGISDRQIRDLQRDLRQLGYLKKGIDGDFGKGTETAVQALQHDLLFNYGRSTQRDGNAPVRVLDYNKGRVVQVTGEVDEKLADCISDMLAAPEFPKLPRADNPEEENSRMVSILKAASSRKVPLPFLMAILRQESGLQHFNVPRRDDEDTFITVGLDTNASEKHVITSRGYGAGQYTLFHHPPRKSEIDDFMLDVRKNIRKAMNELREKFDHFLNGNSSGTRADDRIAECGSGALTLCIHQESDSRYMKDCAQCMSDAGQMDIEEGVTRLYRGSKYFYVATQYYKKAHHVSVPVRKNIGCDWPYAVRRYNGAGINSYHYQARILKNVLIL